MPIVNFDGRRVPHIFLPRQKSKTPSNSSVVEIFVAGEASDGTTIGVQ